MEIVKYLWQLPQHLLALLLIKIVGAEKERQYLTSVVYRHSKLFGVSLGKYIIVSAHHKDKTIKHEYGHSIQSLRYGPFYLLIIGLPSFTMNVLTLFGILDPRGYYKRWPESKADKLGGVKR